MIQAAFFDIDGTLIDHEHGSIVPASTLESLWALRRRGVKLFVATGRIPNMLGPIRALFDFDGFVTLNGQLVLDREGNVLHKMAHRPEAIRALMDVVKKEAFPCLVIEEQESFGVADDPVIRRHFDWLHLPVPPLYDIARLESHPVLQFLAYLPWEERDKLSPIPFIEPTCAGGDILDVLPEGGGKEVGIAATAAYYGFARKDILVFGDGKNDVRMLRWAGTGIALGNGDSEAKAAADYITSPIYEDGIQRALLHLGALEEKDFAAGAGKLGGTYGH